MGSNFGSSSDPASGQSPVSSTVRVKLNHLQEFCASLLVNWNADAAACTVRDTILNPVGSILEYGGSSAPSGYLLMNADYNRTTYAALYAIVGTTYGPGDGSTTFGLHKDGVLSIGAGTHSRFEVSTASSGNGFTVVSNSAAWITGMPVVWSALSGFTTSGSAGPTYYVVRISATNVRFATTLALAQDGAPDITISGSGSCKVTYTGTAWTRGQIIGEEAHAQSSTELYRHYHGCGDGSLSGGGGNDSRSNAQGSIATNWAGGNVAMNLHTPTVVTNFIIKY
jgi:microcystin-dependent protein